MELGDKLQKFFVKNNQAKFAKAIGVKESTVTRWKNNRVPPNYENCLRIAKLLNEHPITIFELAGRPGYIDLFKHFSPDYQPVEIVQTVGEIQQIFDEFSPEMQALVRSRLDDCKKVDKHWIPDRSVHRE